MNISILSIQAITRDEQCQPRAYLIPDVIEQYAEEMSEGSIFPPVVVFHEGDTYWLADGFHRVAAAEQAGLDVVNCEIREGTIRDAMLYAVGANATHGLRRTNHDKRQAVETLIEDPDWSQWSDREIARRCAVSHTFVQNLKESLATVASEGEAAEAATVKYTDRWGGTRLMNITNIGTSSRPSDPAEVRIEFTELAKIGRAVRHKDVKEAVAKTRTQTKAEPIPVREWGAKDDEEFEEYDRSPSTPEQCQAVVTALEALLLTLQRPEDDGHERVMLTEVIEYLTTHANANADDQKWMLTELAELYMDIMRANQERLEALAALRAKAS